MTACADTRRPAGLGRAARLRSMDILTRSKGVLNERRRYGTTAPKPTFSKSSLLSTPVVEYLEDEEIDAEILPLEEISLNITDRAAEVTLLH